MGSQFTLPGFRVLSRDHEYDENSPKWVNELTEQGQWNTAVLNTLFSSWEVEAIKRIPLSERNMADEWAWHYTKDGIYSVRSGYFHKLRATRFNNAAGSSSPNLQVWKVLWSPRKSKHLAGARRSEEKMGKSGIEC